MATIKEHIKKAVFMPGVTHVGDYALSRLNNLTSVTIPDSVINIGECAFENCTSLTSVTIPDSVINIGNCAFEFCFDLTNVTIPDSVTNIGNGAFGYCSDLTRIKVSGSTKISSFAFGDCNKLSIIDLGNATLESGAISSSNPNLTKLTITSAVTLESNAIAFSELTSLTITNSKAILKKGAFQYCSKLRNITLPKSHPNINDQSFEGTLWYDLKTNLNIYDVTLAKTTFPCNGKDRRPAVTIRYDDITLTDGVDYTVAYMSNKYVGAGVIMIVGIGNYAGNENIIRTFTITKGDTTITAKDVTADWSTKEQTVKLGAKSASSLTYKSDNKAVKVSKKGGFRHNRGCEVAKAALRF